MTAPKTEQLQRQIADKLLDMFKKSATPKAIQRHPPLFPRIVTAEMKKRKETA